MGSASSHSTISTPSRAAIALGSNLGDRSGALEAAAGAVAAHPQISLLRAATPVETEPVGPVPQGRYINSAITVETSLRPRELLDALLCVERTLGRQRGGEVRWGPRVIDLDLLLYDDTIINHPGLIVPHPRMHERRFVLGPLAEIAGSWVHPVLRRTIADLLACIDLASRDAHATSTGTPSLEH